MPLLLRLIFLFGLYGANSFDVCHLKVGTQETLFCKKLRDLRANNTGQNGQIGEE